MDRESIAIIHKVWKHSRIKGKVWMPHILNIGSKNQRFVEGVALDNTGAIPPINHNADWYWTPAVSSTSSRKATAFPAQRVMWVDCDDDYDKDKLLKLNPTFIWETSPNHLQAVWLLRDVLQPHEFHKNGFVGLLTHVIGADPSGVDIGQLLRVPASTHHKQGAYKGNIVKATGGLHTTGSLLTRLALELGFSRYLASELGAEDPYGDRSKMLWKMERTAAELGLDKELTFKLLKACKWNKWRDEPERLRADIDKAYEATPNPDKAVTSVDEPPKTDSPDPEEETPAAWSLQQVNSFTTVLKKPLKWIVPGIIPESGCGLLVASPKVGKTRIAIEVAVGVATSSQPLGLTVQQQNPVGFFSLEDGEYLFSSRLNSALNQLEDRNPYHWDGYINNELEWIPPKSMPLYAMFDQIDLSDGFDKQRLYETITDYNLKVVVIDTLSMAIGKSDVSSSTDMYNILKDIKTIAKATKCAVLFIHHTRKRVFDKGESIQERVLGSTALHAWCDYILSLAPPEEGSDFLRLAVQTKMATNSYQLDTDLKIIPQFKLEETE